jgi:hydroxymethylpyrimidine/phosphomethylpyrimidine kinase
MVAHSEQPVALSIAGSDSGGNAGIQADLRAFHVFGVHGCTAITALTAQNPLGVAAVSPVTAAFLGQQLDAVLDCYAVGAIKTGMLATADLIAVVAERLSARPLIAKVIDPVMVATSGARLLEDSAITVLQSRLLPLATLITPNLPEAEVLLGRPIQGLAGATAAARELSARYGCAVLVKGGHEAQHRATDVLCDGRTAWRVTTPVVPEPLSTHGTGCALSAAITAALACGRTLAASVVAGKAYVYAAIRDGSRVGPRATVMGTPAQVCVTDVAIEEI